MAVARMEPMLRLPGDRFDLLTEPALAGAQGVPDRRAVAVGMGRLHQDAAQVGIARLGDGPTPRLGPARVLARYGSAVAHELAGVREAGELADLGDDRHGAE